MACKKAENVSCSVALYNLLHIMKYSSPHEITELKDKCNQTVTIISFSPLMLSRHRWNTLFLYIDLWLKSLEQKP